MKSRGRYTTKALKRAKLENSRFYSIQELGDLLIKGSPQLLKNIPPSNVAVTLAQYIRRSVPSGFTTKDTDGKKLFLGASLLFPIEGMYPETREQLEKELQAALVPGQVQPPRVHRVRVPLRRWPMLVAIMLGVAILSGWSTTLFMTYVREGPTEFARYHKRSMTDKETYYRAVANYDIGNFDTAERIAWNLLSFSGLAPETEGDAFHLLAKIYSRKGNYAKSLELAGLAQESYSADPTRFSNRLRNLETFRAVILSKNGQYVEGALALAPLFENEAHPSYKGYIALMASDAWFWAGDYRESYLWNTRGLDAYLRGGDENGRANALMNQAWLLAIFGELERAGLVLAQASTLARKMGDTDKVIYIQVVQALIDKCATGTTNLPEIHTADKDLERYIEFVETFVCSDPARVIEDQPPPQDDRPNGSGLQH